MMRICATKYLEKIFAVNIYKEHVAKIYIRKKASYDLEMKRQFNWKKKKDNDLNKYFTKVPGK